MATVLALIDHPNLDLIIGPVIVKLQERGVKTKALVVNAGKADYLIKNGIPYQTNMNIQKEFFQEAGKKLFLNAADQYFPGHLLGRNLDTLCRNNAVRSMTIEHGSFLMGRYLNKECLFEADKMAVIGKREYDEYRKLGVREERLILTGFPPFDEYFEFAINNPFVEGRYIFLAGQNHNPALLIPKGGHYTIQQWVGVLREMYRILLTNFPDLTLVIKPHPAEPYHNTVQLYHDAIDPPFRSRITVLDSKYSNILAISQSAFVVSFSTSVLLESLLLRKRVLGILTSDILPTGLIDAEKFGVVLIKSNPAKIENEILQRLGHCLNGSQGEIRGKIDVPDEFIEKYIYKFDGKASERVADAILEMMEPELGVPKKSGIGRKINRPIFKEIGFERYMRLMGIAEEIAHNCDETYTILDIGSHDDFLRKFVPKGTYFSYNGFISQDNKTPYNDDSYDVVVAADVLEHVSIDDRKVFILELFRLAKKKVVFSFPTEQAEDFEKFALTLIPGHRWLQEHVDKGLPRKADVDIILDQTGIPYEVKTNHRLASWLCALILNHTNIATNLKHRINEFLQTKCFEMEQRGTAYRYIYTVNIPEGYDKKNISNYCAATKDDKIPAPVSIIIPVFNKAEYTSRCLNSIWNHTPTELYEIVIVDNGSSDNTKSLVQTWRKNNFTVISNESNLGFAKACNQGAHSAKGRYIVLLNNDTEVQAGWLEPLIETVERNPDIGVVGSKLLYPDGSVQHAGVIIIELKNKVSLLPRHVFMGAAPSGVPIDQPMFFQAVTAACLMIKREVFETAGGFDEEYWNGSEDVDFCFKLQQAGLKVVYQPKSVVIHHESKSGRERVVGQPKNNQRLRGKWAGFIKPDIIDYGYGVEDGFSGKVLSISLPENHQDNKVYIEKAISWWKQRSDHLGKTAITIVVPVFNALDELVRCLASIIANTSGDYRLVIIDDASTDERVEAFLKRFAIDHPQATILKHGNNRGYTATINEGCRLSDADIVLLNSDTQVTPKWLEKLNAAAYCRENVATVTPLSNAAGAFSIPIRDHVNSLPQGMSINQFGHLLEELSMKMRPEVPTGNGFCMYITRQALHKIGGFDEQTFPEGYGEENDFCMRAISCNFLNLIEDSTFVYHERGASFKDRKKEIIGKNQEKLVSKHPQYTRLVKQWLDNDPIDLLRKRLSDHLSDHSSEGSRLEKPAWTNADPSHTNRMSINRAQDHASGKIRRVLFVNHSIPPYELSGTPISTLNHVIGMKAKGLEMAVLIPSVEVKEDFKRESIHGFTVYKVPSLNKYEAFLGALGGKELSRYLEVIDKISRDFSPDVVQINDYVFMPAEILGVFSMRGSLIIRNVCNPEEICHMDSPVVSTGSDCRLCSGPHDANQCTECFFIQVVGTPKDQIRQVDKQTVLKLIGKRFASIQYLYEKIVDGVVFTDSRFKDYFRGFIEIPEKKVRVIPRGFHFDFQRIEKTVDVLDSQVHFALIGNLTFRKGLDIVLKAFERIGDYDGFKLHVFGGASDACISWINKLRERFSQKIIYHGPFKKEDFLSIVKGIHVCIVPSYFETTNRVVREVLYCGIPVIATDFFGSSIIEDGVNGLKIPLGDSAALADRMRNIIRNPGLVNQLSKGAVNTRIPTLEGEVDALSKFYTDIDSSRQQEAASSGRGVAAEKLLGASGVEIKKEDTGIQSLPTFLPVKTKGAVENPKKDDSLWTVNDLPENKRLISIIILAYNQLEYSQKCLERIFRHTRQPFELIIVDNGSTDGTADYLNGVREGGVEVGGWKLRVDKEGKVVWKVAPTEVKTVKVKGKKKKQIKGKRRGTGELTCQYLKIIHNEKNQGFAAGNNQGIAAAKGECILLLNNDVLVTENWLSGLLECHQSARDIGIVGPMTNNISGIQKMEEVGYKSLEGLDEYAASFRGKNRYRRIPFRRIVGFCILFRRELVNRIGLLDETFGTGNFEDDDFCLRAELAGYRNFIAGDVFIHHFGSRSFIGNKIDYRRTMKGNHSHFLEKWNRLDPQSAEGKKYLSLRGRETAKLDYEKGQAKKAMDRLLAVIRLGIDAKASYYDLAEILLDAKQYDQALKVLSQMPEADEDDHKYALLGYCREGLANPLEAQKLAEQALSLNPSNALALNLQGILSYRKGDKEQAQNYFQKAAAADRGFGEPHTNLGVIRWEGNRKEEALHLLERGFILSPTITDILQMYHAAITNKGEFVRAEKNFREAQALHPFHKRIRFFLIDILLKQGKNEEAMEQIEQSMSLFGIEDEILSAALAVRKRIGPQEKSSHGQRARISLCMIVKDEENDLLKCLRSVKPVVDEMIVVDTGSTDRTKDIATALGAKVSEFPWENDFSAARNFSISQAKGDWILVLDADEVISPLDHASLLALTKEGNHMVGYSFVTRNYLNTLNFSQWTANDGTYEEEAGNGWIPSDKVRLFPRDRRIHFENAVHEFVEPSLEKNGIPFKICSIPVHHYGKLNERKEEKKGQDYFLLGKKKLDKSGKDFRSLRELAVQANVLKRYEESAELWYQVIRLQPKSPEPYFNLASIYMNLGKFQEASAHSKKAIELDPDCKEAVLNYSIVEFYLGNIKNVISTLESLLSKTPEYPLGMALLAAAYRLDGERGKSQSLIAKIKKAGFNYDEYSQNTAKNLIALGRSESAGLLLEIMGGKEPREQLPVVSAPAGRISL